MTDKQPAEPSETPESLFDAREVAEWLKVAVSAVYDQATKGQIPHLRLWRGRRRTLIRFRREDIEKYLLDRTAGQAK